MRKDAQQISIVTAPINIPKEEMYECAIRDRVLIEHICKFRKQLESQNIEVFARKENILITEHGYYSAMYTDDIRNMEGGIDNPIPFKGKDGRMKVRVIAENGDETFQDLASLVAMAYVPNIAKYKKVFFKDYCYENCSADNLVWLSNFDYWVASNFYKLFKIKLRKWN